MFSTSNTSLSGLPCKWLRAGSACLLLCVSYLPLQAQNTTSNNMDGKSASPLPDAPQPNADKDAVTIRKMPLNLLKDQGAIWTSPLRLRTRDLKWFIPLAAATGVSLGTDHYTMQSVVSHDANLNQRSVDVSNILTGGLLVAPVAFYGVGYLKGDERARETGLLGAETILNGLVVEQGLKLATWRERPTQDNARGLFFQGSAGVDSSFPSSHTVLTWSAASVIASEYPSRWAQVGVYALASGVSLTRVLGEQHFPTDVLVGSATGWLLGHYVYRTHHHDRPR